MVDIPANLDGIRARIAAAEQARGPGPKVQLIAVSKFHDVAAIEAAYAAGQRDFGENYVQALVQKAEALKARCPEIRWHLIGALQRNKVAKVLGLGLIHTVDRPQLVQALHTRAQDRGIVQDCLIQVNPGEAQKAGVGEAELQALVQAVAPCAHLRCRGLMMIPPQGSSEQTRDHFAWLAHKARELAPALGLDQPELSMGMSGDFELAIAQGATWVRVGTAIFGPRPAP